VALFVLTEAWEEKGLVWIESTLYLELGLGLALALFLHSFREEWYFFGQCEMQRNMVLYWGGPASVLQPRKLSRKERKFRENKRKNGLSAQP
jgi:hypothetical protein